jgi:pimeloyl-ACP methyl ester carboxylesterase
LTARALDAARREQVIEDSLKVAPQAKTAWPTVGMREDMTAAVASIEVPTIIISGELDQVDRIATLQAELLPRIPHAAMHILPGTGHLLAAGSAGRGGATHCAIRHEDRGLVRRVQVARKGAGRFRCGTERWR